MWQAKKIFFQLVLKIFVSSIRRAQPFFLTNKRIFITLGRNSGSRLLFLNSFRIQLLFGHLVQCYSTRTIFSASSRYYVRCLCSILLLFLEKILLSSYAQTHVHTHTCFSFLSRSSEKKLLDRLERKRREKKRNEGFPRSKKISGLPSIVGRQVGK